MNYQERDRERAIGMWTGAIVVWLSVLASLVLIEVLR